MRARLLGYGLAFLVTSGLSVSALAMSGISYLDHPLPEQFREHAEAMVRTLRPQDANDTNAKFLTIQGAASNPEFVVLRIEAGCRRGLCMTVIARNDDRGMVPELIIEAGAAMIVSDFQSSLWGEAVWPVHFQGEGSATLSIFRRGKQWAVTFCATCFEWPASKNAISTQEAAPPMPSHLPMSFEEFQAILRR